MPIYVWDSWYEELLYSYEDKELSDLILQPENCLNLPKTWKIPGNFYVLCTDGWYLVIQSHFLSQWS